MRMQCLAVLALLLSGCGADEAGSAEEPLCFEYQPAPISRPNDVREACLPPDWQHTRAAVRGPDFESCDRYLTDAQYVVYFWVRPNHAADAGHVEGGCVPGWTCLQNDLNNPSCCDDVDLSKGNTDCF